ncbi:unnamed protein product, partial [Ectocarpus sp. 12 AP-2014]
WRTTPAELVLHGPERGSGGGASQPASQQQHRAKQKSSRSAPTESTRRRVRYLPLSLPERRARVENALLAAASICLGRCSSNPAREVLCRAIAFRERAEFAVRRYISTKSPVSLFLSPLSTRWFNPFE